VNLLLIYYYFPPRGGVAVQRVLKLCKYLPQFGIDVKVLTSGAEYHSFVDESLLKEIPHSVEVLSTGEKRAREGQFGRKNLLIDSFISWVPRAIRKAREIIEEGQTDVVMITSPPHSQQLIGLALKRSYGIPWIADFRDPWTSDSRFMRTKSRYSIWLERWIEKRILQKADLVVATCEGALESFREHARGGKRQDNPLNDKFVRITNGYDPDDFGEMDFLEDDCLTFSYVGSTGEYISDPSFFLKALRKVLDENPSMEEKIQLNFVGNAEARIKRKVEELKLSSVVRFHGHVSHREAVRLMCRSHVLLFFEIPVRDGKPTLVLPSKLFEYMAARRPIMAMATDGDSAQIVREYGLGAIVDPLNIEKMAEKIGEYFGLFSRKQLGLLPPAPAVFSREAQARKFAEMIQRIAL